MLSYIVKRLIVGVMVMFAVSAITFTLTNAAIDPARAIAGEGAASSDVEQIRKSYGFDRPLHIQYGSWLISTLKGDFGNSYRQKRPVLDIIIERLPVTLKLGGLAFLFAILLSIPLAIIAAMYPNSWIDRFALVLALFGQAMPTFWFALLGIVIFSVNLRWLPASGSASFINFILPAIALGYYAAPTIMRLTRAGMIEVLNSDYVRTARAKGLKESRVVLKHALRNAILPVVSVSAVQLGFMLGGSVVIETIFAMQGVGYLAWEAISLSDLPVAQAIVLMIAAIYIILTIFSDIINAWLDPRIRIH